MSKYKVVKEPERETLYRVYKQILFSWKYIGNFCSEPNDDVIVARAKEFATPKTIYFDA